MPSMPTDSRTRPGVTPVVSCSVGRELAVRRARRVDDQAAHVTDVGQVAEQLHRVDELACPASTPPRSSNASTAPAPRGRYFCCGRVPRARRQARVVHGLDLVARLQPLGDRLRVRGVPLHPQRQRLEALQEQEALNGAIAGPRSRSSCTRSFTANAPGPSAGQ